MSITDTEITYSLTSSKLQEVLSLPDREAESIIFGRIRHIARGWELTYGECGLLCKAVEAYLLYEQRIDPETGQPCDSFARWLRICAPRSVSTCYSALRDVESLKDMPDEEVAQIPASSFSVVKQLSTDVRNDPGVIEAIKTKRTEDLVEHIQKHHPDQHIQHSSVVRFPLSENQKAEFDEAVKRAQLRGAANLSEAVWAICVEVNREWRMEEEIESAVLEGNDEEGTQA